MSKNVKLNDKTYSGVSTVKLPTSTGGTATFKDVDEIVTPSGTKSITANGTHDVTNYANVNVNVSSSSSSGGTEIEAGTRHEFTIRLSSANYNGSCACTLQPTHYIAKVYTENPETLPPARLVNAFTIVDQETLLAGEINLSVFKIYTHTGHSAETPNILSSTQKSLPVFDGETVTWNVGAYFEPNRDYKLVIIELNERL